MIPSLSTGWLDRSTFGSAFMSISSGSFYLGGKLGILDSFNYSLHKYGVFDHLVYNPQGFIGKAPTFGGILGRVDKIIENFRRATANISNILDSQIKPEPNIASGDEVRRPADRTNINENRSGVIPSAVPRGSDEPAAGDTREAVPAGSVERAALPSAARGVPEISRKAPAATRVDPVPVPVPASVPDPTGPDDAGEAGTASDVPKPSRTLRMNATFQPAGEVRLSDIHIINFINNYNGDGSNITSPKMEICLKGGQLYLKLGYNGNINIDQNSNEFKTFIEQLHSSIGSRTDVNLCVGPVGEKGLSHLQTMKAQNVNGNAFASMYDKAFKRISVDEANAQIGSIVSSFGGKDGGPSIRSYKDSRVPEHTILSIDYRPDKKLSSVDTADLRRALSELLDSSAKLYVVIKYKDGEQDRREVYRSNGALDLYSAGDINVFNSNARLERFRAVVDGSSSSADSTHEEEATADIGASYGMSRERTDNQAAVQSFKTWVEGNDEFKDVVDVQIKGDGNVIELAPKGERALSKRDSVILLNRIRELARGSSNIIIRVGTRSVLTGRDSLGRGDVKKLEKGIAEVFGNRRVPVATGSEREMVSFTDRQGPLDVNTDDTVSYRFLKSRSQGEADLRNLIGSSTLEESWIYLKGQGIDGEDREGWYEIGSNSTGGRVSTRLDAIIDAARDFGQVSEVSVYHTHPRGTGSPMESETPSKADVESLLTMVQYLEHNREQLGLPQGIKLDFRITTPLGGWRLDPNIELASSNPDNFQELMIDIIVSIEEQRMRTVLAENMPESGYEGQPEEKAVRFADVMSNSGLQFKYSRSQP